MSVYLNVFMKACVNEFVLQPFQPHLQTQEALRGGMAFLGGQKWKRDMGKMYLGGWIAGCGLRFD